MTGFTSLRFFNVDELLSYAKKENINLNDYFIDWTLNKLVYYYSDNREY